MATTMIESPARPDGSDGTWEKTTIHFCLSYRQPGKARSAFAHYHVSDARQLMALLFDDRETVLPTMRLAVATVDGRIHYLARTPLAQLPAGSHDWVPNVDASALLSDLDALDQWCGELWAATLSVFGTYGAKRGTRAQNDWNSWVGVFGYRPATESEVASARQWMLARTPPRTLDW